MASTTANSLLGWSSRFMARTSWLTAPQELDPPASEPDHRIGLMLERPKNDDHAIDWYRQALKSRREHLGLGAFGKFLHLAANTLRVSFLIRPLHRPFV